MSVLIDELFAQKGNTHTNINGKWYISKCVGYFSPCVLYRRMKDAFSVLIGKSFAYHYKVDERN
jgi:hypothetical protein